MLLSCRKNTTPASIPTGTAIWPNTRTGWSPCMTGGKKAARSGQSGLRTRWKKSCGKSRSVRLSCRDNPQQEENKRMDHWYLMIRSLSGGRFSLPNFQEDFLCGTWLYTFSHSPEGCLPALCWCAFCRRESRRTKNLRKCKGGLDIEVSNCRKALRRHIAGGGPGREWEKRRLHGGRRLSGKLVRGAPSGARAAGGLQRTVCQMALWRSADPAGRMEIRSAEG